VADLRARRLELTRAAVREAILDGDGETFRVVVESLADEFDLVEIAMAAIRLAHEAQGGDVEDEEDIPEARPAPPRESRDDRGRAGGRSRGRETDARKPARGGDRKQRSGGATAVLHIGAGRKLGIRPQDLVGAIANEAGVEGHNIGIVEISDRFSLVEVPEEVARDVIDALRDGTVRGRKVTVRRERGRG
jgi:ATP-dependent RNA helicase DeaD